VIGVDEILHVVKEGLACLDISLGMSIEKLQEIYGAPNEIGGDSSAGYLNYGYIRVGYLGDYVDEVAIMFDDDPQFKLEIEELKEIKCISGQTTINQFVHVLNYAGLRWFSEYRENHLDYISITVEAGSEVLFDLETGHIMRIALLDSRRYPIKYRILWT